MDTRQAGLIARYSARYSVRGGIGLVFLLLSLTFGLVVAHITLQPVEMIVKQEQQRSKKKEAMSKTEVARIALEQVEREFRPTVAWFLSPSGEMDEDEAEAAREESDRWARHLIEEKPLLMSAILLVLLFGWPLCAVFGAFDVYAGDIASRQLRYQLLRADRASIYFGRLVGVMVTFTVVLVILGTTIATYIGLKLPIYPVVDLVAWTAYGILALLVATLPFVALCAWVSASVSSSFVSLTLASILMGGVPLFALAARAMWAPAGYLNMALPWGFQIRLLHPDASQVLLAVSGCLLQAGLFTWFGYRKFMTRDL
jgi:hypothetical protein